LLAVPSARAYEWQTSGIWESGIAERAFDSGPSWFTAGPAWMMNAMPGANFRARQYVIDSAGDLQESTTQYNGYVGTLHDAFNVSLFNNVSGFATASGSKTSSVYSPDATLATKQFDGGTAVDTAVGASQAWGTTTAWRADGVPTSTDDVLFDNAFRNPLQNVQLGGSTTRVANSLTIDLTTNQTWALGATATSSDSTLTLTTGNITRNNEAANSSVVTIGATTGSGIGSGILTLATSATGFTFTNSDTDATLAIEAIISGSTKTVAKNGAGLVSFTGSSNNTYTGNTTINTGILELARSSSGTVHAIAGNITIGDGGTTAGLDILRLAGSGGDQIADTAILSFNGTGSDAGTFRLNGQSETVGGLVSTSGAGVIEDNNATASTLTLNVNTTDRSFAGIIQNGATGTLALVKIGNATQTLSGNNTYTGGTTINAGTITAGSSTAIGNGSLTFNNGSTGKFQLNGNNISITDLSFSQTNSGTPIVENGAATPATLTLNPTSTFAFAGVLQDGSTGTLGLTLNGNGLVLYGTNTYTGDTTINAGTLTFNSSTSPNHSGSANGSTIRLGSTATNSAAATLALGANPPNTITSPIIVQASVSGTEGQRLFINTATTGLNTYGGSSITLNTGLTLQSATGGQFLLTGGTIDFGTKTLSVNSNAGANVDNANLQGTVTIADTLTSGVATGGSIVKDGSTTLIIQSTGNSYTGNTAAGVAANSNGTRIGGGVLGIFGDTSLGLAPSTATNNVFFTASAIGSTTAPTLRADAAGVTLASTRSISIASGVTAQFDSNGNTGANAFTINGNINGSGNLAKTGAGTLVLGGANTYTGTTLVSAGTLNAAVTNALGGTTGSITVNRGGTLLVSGNGNLDRINDSTPIVLGSATGSGTATFQRGTPTSGTVISEGVGAQRTGPLITDLSGTSAAGLGALSLQSNATFDFGTTGVGTFTFGTFTANSNTLTILNWTSSAVAASFTSGVDGTDDRLIFSGLPTDIGFINFNGTAATFITLDNGFYEVVPIPEPGTWIGAVLALGAIGVMGRRHLRKKLKL
jgi:autotransporter-associated beta strand protein